MWYIYFQKIGNKLSSKWTVGQVETFTRSMDNIVLRVNIWNYNAGEDETRFTDQAVRTIGLLFNILHQLHGRGRETCRSLTAKVPLLTGKSSLPSWSEIHFGNSRGKNGISLIETHATVPVATTAPGRRGGSTWMSLPKRLASNREDHYVVFGHQGVRRGVQRNYSIRHIFVINILNLESQDR